MIEGIGRVANIRGGRDYPPRLLFSGFVNFLKSEEARKEIILIVDRPAT